MRGDEPWLWLGPQLFQHGGDPAVDRPEPMEARVTAAAEGDQGGWKVRGPAVVDDERGGRAADAAEAAVAAEDFLAPSGEARPRGGRLW